MTVVENCRVIFIVVYLLFYKILLGAFIKPKMQ